jgi:hypothetical protein
MSDSEFEREMAEALENAEAAEVVCVILPIINQCLVFDGRSGPDDPPRLTVSAPLGSGERRLRHVNKTRPHLERARELAVLPWSGSINAFANSRIWGMLQDRMLSSGYDGINEQCEAAIEELHQWERRSLVSMIRGQGPFHTIWSRTGS